MTQSGANHKDLKWKLNKEISSISNETPTVNALVMTLDRQGRIVSFNQACEQTTGYSFSEVRGKQWDLFLIPEERAQVQAIYETLKSGSAAECKHESDWVTKNGNRCRISWSNSVLINYEGIVEYIISTGVDVTENKRRVQALSEQHQGIQGWAAIANRVIDDGLWDWNLHSNEAYFSPGWKAMLGYQENEIGNSPDEWLNRVHPEDCQQLWEAIAAQQSGRLLHLSREHRVLHKDGTYRWLLYRGQAIWDTSGKIYRLAGSMIDITEHKQAEAALRERIQREQALNQVVQAIRNSLDLEGIFLRAVQEIGKLLPVDRVGITQYLPERQLWRNVAEHRNSPDVPRALGIEIPDQGNRFAAQLKRSEVVRIDDVSAVQDEINRGLAQTFPGAWLLVPLPVGSGIWGSVSLFVRNRPHSWQDSEVELCLAIAAQLAIAIQQAQLLHQSRMTIVLSQEQATRLEAEITERQRTEQALRSLHKISAARKLSFEQCLQGLLALGRRHFNLEMGALGRVENDLYEVVAAQVQPKSKFQIAKGSCWDLAQTYCNETLGRKEPIAFASAGTSHWCSHPAYVSKRIEAYIGMPVVVAGAIYGTLSFFSLRVRQNPFTTEEKELLKLMAQWVGAKLERQQAEEALRESEARFRTLVANIPGAAYRCTPDWQCLFISEAIEDIVGYPASDFCPNGTRTLARLINPEDTERVQQVVTEAVRIGQPFMLEYRLVHADGSNRWVDERGQGVFNETGELLYLDRFIFDITNRKQAEEGLRQSEARFRELAQREALLNQLASQIRRSLDLNTTLETAVHEIRNLLQIDRCFFLWYRPNTEQPVMEVVAEAKTASFPSLIGHCFPITALGSWTTRVFNKEITRVDNVRDLIDPMERRFFFSIGYTSMLALPIHTTSGEIGVISCGHSSGSRPWRDFEAELLQAVADQLAIAIDQAQLLHQSRTATVQAREQATQLERALDELQQTQAQLVQSEKMSSLGQMVAGVAHEINNPVNFIYGNLTYVNQYTEELLNLIQLYQEYYPHPATEIQAETEAIELNFIRRDLPKILSSMKIGADRISEIVLSLRNFSRLDESEMKWVDIHEGLDNTLMILAHRLKSQSTEAPEIQVVKDYGNLPLVQCYPGQLNQVFMNILTNAIEAINEFHQEHPHEASKSGLGTIFIGTGVLANYNQAIVLISDNGCGMTPEIRNRIFDPFFTTKPVGQGTGLGMSISYKIVVEKHGGQLECLSAPELGSAFLIYIPIRQSS